MSQKLQEMAFGLSVLRHACRPDVPRHVQKVALDLDKLAGRAGDIITNVGFKAPVLVGAGAGALWTALDRMVGGGSAHEQEQLERIERFRTAASKIERELTTSKRTKSIPARILL